MAASRLLAFFFVYPPGSFFFEGLYLPSQRFNLD